MIETDTLSDLGFSLTQAGVTKDPVDLLPDTTSNSQSRAQEVEVGGRELELKETSGELEGTVALIRPVRVPGRHMKLVRAGVSGRGGGLGFFEPDTVNLGKRGLSAVEAIAEVSNANITLVLADHFQEPVCL